jgi:hypothetical protein
MTGMEDVYSDVYTDHYFAWVWAPLPAPEQPSDKAMCARQGSRKQFEAYKGLVGKPVLDTALVAAGSLKARWDG